MQNACQTGHNDTVLVLISRGSDVFAKNNDGEMPLHWACWEGSKVTVLTLIARGADVSSRDNYG